MSVKEKILSEGVVFITEKQESGIRVYSLSNQVFKLVTITLDFSNSTGVTYLSPPTPTSTIEVLPFTTVQISTVSHSDSYNLSLKYNYSIDSVSDEISATLLSPYNSLLQEKLISFKRFLSNKDTLSLDPSLFPPELNFIDPDFPPNESSLDFGMLKKTDSIIHWRRAKDFLQKDFKVFDKITPYDIKQGQLGNCWFLCAISGLAEKPAMVEKLFIDREVNESGFYRVKVCKNGEWVVVVVDDYFPCKPYGEPIYSKANTNEIWVLLLEKAYAKLHGSYAALNAGSPSSAFIDLTGLPSFKFEISETEMQETHVNKDDLWDKIKQYDSENALISLSTPKNSTTGLVGDHAYTVLSAKEVMNNRLLWIRNPWGSFEWSGDWSTNSALWTDDIKNEFSPVLDDNDGSFWMSYQDVIDHFCEVNLCTVNFNEEKRVKSQFESVLCEDSYWILPQKCFYLQANETGKAVIGIHQEDQRIACVKDRRKYLTVSIVVVEVDENGEFKGITCETCDDARDVQVEVVLESGKKYLLVPRVADFTCGRNYGQEVEGFEWMDGETLHPVFTSSIKDLFFKWKKSLSGQLEYNEFSEMMKIAGVYIDEPTFTNILNDFPSFGNGLSSNGLVEYIKIQFINLGNSTINDWFLAWGYDKDLFGTKTRNFALTAHSNFSIDLEPVNEPSWGIYKKTHELILRTLGEDKVKAGGVITKCFKGRGTSGFLFGILNENTEKAHATLDLSQSSNLVFNENKNIFELELDPNQLKILPYFKIAPGAPNYNLRSAINVKFIE